MASFHALFKWDPYFHRIVLVGIPSIVFLLAPGKHIIQTSPDERKEGNYCGLFPMKGSATVTTTGLGWDLVDEVMNFGTFVSSSNYIRPDSFQVTVKTSSHLLWTSSSSLSSWSS
jgi:thiamine pyrophosphokinase